MAYPVYNAPRREDYCGGLNAYTGRDLRLGNFICGERRGGRGSRPTRRRGEPPVGPFSPLGRGQRTNTSKRDANGHTPRNSPFVTFRTPNTTDGVPGKCIIGGGRGVSNISITSRISTVNPGFTGFVSGFHHNGGIG